MPAPVDASGGVQGTDQVARAPQVGQAARLDNATIHLDQRTVEACLGINFVSSSQDCNVIATFGERNDGRKGSSVNGRAARGIGLPPGGSGDGDGTLEQRPVPLPLRSLDVELPSPC
jgi:hypothetical protein